jgi:thiamine biosynthesis lipoprotein
MRCERVRRTRPLLGTFVEISLAGVDAGALHASANAAFDTIAHIHEIMSFHAADSDISRLNNGAIGEAVQIDAHTWRVIQQACEISQASGGVFDITVGGAMMARGALPGMLRRKLDRNASFRDIELLADCRVRLRRPLAIDVGGIAKGYAVDCAVGVLQAMGVASGCVNAGGDLRAFGDEDIPVDVRDPLYPAIMGAQVNIRDRAFATSANYAASENFSSAGIVLDPRDDAMVMAGRSASVSAATCMIADALAKCVLVLGHGCAPLLRQYEADGFLLGQGSGPVLIDSHAYSSSSPAQDTTGAVSVPTKSVSVDADATRVVGAVL